MEQKIQNNARRGAYKCPSATVFSILAGVFCASDGSTENYGNQSIWGQGTDNE